MSDRICADEGATNLSSLNKFGGFLVPTGDVVQIAVTADTGENFCHIRFLLLSLKTFADEGRVANNKIDGGRNIFPVQMQGVAFGDIGVRFQRQKI